jgi:hypothetical protein
MENSNYQRMFLFGIVAMAAAPAVDAQMSKCTDAAGKVTYQQKPCEVGSTAKTLNVEAARTPASSSSVPAPSIARSSASELSRRVQQDTSASELSKRVQQDIGLVLPLKLGCDVLVPGFAARVASDYAKFRQQYPEATRTFESGTEFKAFQDEGKRIGASGNRSPETTAQDKKQCDGLAAGLAEFGAPAVARMQSPELAWQGMLSALREGDHALAARFLTGQEAQRLGQALPGMHADAMRAMADSFEGFQLSYKDEYIAEVIVTRKFPRGNRVDSIYFAKIGPNWKVGKL